MIKSTTNKQAPHEAMTLNKPSSLVTRSVFTDAETARTQDVHDSSPRTYNAPTKQRPLVRTTIEGIKEISATLRAQKLAGKNDSAEMYRGKLSPIAPRTASACSSPRSASSLASPRSPGSTFSELDEDVALLSDVSDDDEFEGYRSDDDAGHATLNTGWHEWGVYASSDDEDRAEHGATTKSNVTASSPRTKQQIQSEVNLTKFVLRRYGVGEAMKDIGGWTDDWGQWNEEAPKK